MSLRGLCAIVTGATSGIGAAVARDLSSAGVDLLLTGRRKSRLEELQRQLPGCQTLPGDIVDSELPSQLIRAAVEAFGDVHILINNAGIIETGRVGEVDLERLGKMVRINVEAAFRMSYAALEHFKERRRGHVINISSVLGTKTREGAGAYSGTKYALEALSEALRMELAGSGIRVSCIEPGLVRTELHDHYPVHPAKTLGMSRPLLPEDVARCVRFVLEQPQHVLIPRLMLLPQEGKI